MSGLACGEEGSLGGGGGGKTSTRERGEDTDTVQDKNDKDRTTPSLDQGKV